MAVQRGKGTGRTRDAGAKAPVFVSIGWLRGWIVGHGALIESHDPGSEVGRGRARTLRFEYRLYNPFEHSRLE
jgi:hypothetical protein